MQANKSLCSRVHAISVDNFLDPDTTWVLFQYSALEIHTVQIYVNSLSVISLIHEEQNEKSLEGYQELLWGWKKTRKETNEWVEDQGSMKQATPSQV